MKLYLIDTKTAPKSQRFRWQLVGRNGKVVASSSEGFSSAEECEQNVILTLEGLEEHIHSEQGCLFVEFARRRPARKVKP